MIKISVFGSCLDTPVRKGFYEDLYRAQQEGFARVLQDQRLYDDLSLAYNIYNNKKIGSFVSPDDVDFGISLQAYLPE